MGLIERKRRAQLRSSGLPARRLPACIHGATSGSGSGSSLYSDGQPSYKTLAAVRYGDVTTVRPLTTTREEKRTRRKMRYSLLRRR
jgi:hypothetical protein